MPLDQTNISDILTPETEERYGESRNFKCKACSTVYDLNHLEHICPKCEAAGYYEEVYK